MVLIKILLANILLLVAVASYGQLNLESDTISTSSMSNPNDTITSTQSEVLQDSIPKPVLESTITYSAEDSIIPDFENQKMYMYKGGVINYENYTEELEGVIAASPNPNIKIYMSEWNVWSGLDWRNGLYAGGMLTMFERQGE